MYALEKCTKNKWQRYALCSRHWPLDRVVQALSDSGEWRVVYAPDALSELLSRKRAA